MHSNRIASADNASILHVALAPFYSVIENYGLIWRLAQREVIARFRGSALGILWGFILPLATLGIYTFVFSTIFQARWTTPSGKTTEFALIVFSGLLFFALFSEPIARAPGLIGENASYVKKVVFPLEILPVASFISALVTFLMGMCVLLVGYFLILGLPPATILLLPLLLIPAAFLTVGLTWFVSSLGVFLRDMRQVIPILTTAVLFMSPILYPVSTIPEGLRWIVYANPLTGVLEMSKDLLFWGRIPDPSIFLLTVLLSYVVAWLGYQWFIRTKKAFADVL